MAPKPQWLNEVFIPNTCQWQCESKHRVTCCSEILSSNLVQGTHKINLIGRRLIKYGHTLHIRRTTRWAYHGTTTCRYKSKNCFRLPVLKLHKDLKTVLCLIGTTFENCCSVANSKLLVPQFTRSRWCRTTATDDTVMLREDGHCYWLAAVNWCSGLYNTSTCGGTTTVQRQYNICISVK